MYTQGQAHILDHAHPGRSTFTLLIFVSHSEHRPSGNSSCVVSTQQLDESPANSVQRLKQRSHFLFMKYENGQENWLQDKREGREGRWRKRGCSHIESNPEDPNPPSLSLPSLYTLSSTPLSFSLPHLPISHSLQSTGQC